MSIDHMLSLEIIFALITWTLVISRYVHPVLKKYTIEQALEPILFLHTFRNIGLMFLMSGVTSEVID
jgi:hypothetical protein